MTIPMIAVLVLIAFYFVRMGNTLAKHGQDYTIGPISIFSDLILTIPCLYFAGFFSVWAWPQNAWFILTSIGMGVFLSSPHFVIKGKNNIWTSIIAYAIIWFIYYKGGLFACFPSLDNL